MQQEIRTRIAPSPTGDWHLGNARTALFSYLFAKHHGGKFFLRIEDTDQARLVEGAVERLLDVLDWLDITPDQYEGKPYVTQSENLKRYQEVAVQLVVNGHAYYCFASSEELEAMRHDQEAKKQPPHYDNRWGYRDLPLEEAKKLIDEGKPYVIRQKMPQVGETVVPDIILGEVRVQNKTLDDNVLLKSDGFPTYHLAHIVDDHDMVITHVIRGAEWLPSAPRHIQLLKSLGWDVPVYAHVPVILGPDKGKLSKRHGARPVFEYRDLGYLPEALSNFLLLLGWSSGSEQEFFTREEMVQSFSLERVQPSPAVFDTDRLDWFNANYIRRLSIPELRDCLLAYYKERNPVWQERYESNPDMFDKAVASLRERLITLAEFAELAEFYYTEPKEYDPTLIPAKKQSTQEAVEALTMAVKALQDTSDWSHDGLDRTLRALAERQGMKPGNLLWPIRVALTGLPASPGTFEVLEVLGKETSLKRINHALELLSKI